VLTGWFRTSSCIGSLLTFKRRRPGVGTGCPVPVQLPDAEMAGIVHCDGTAIDGVGGLNPQLPQQLFEVGFVDDHFPRGFSLRTGLHRAFIKGLEETHFGDGILFGARERAAVLRGPALEGGLVDKDFERKSRLAVDGNDVSELAAGTRAALGAIAFEEIILIHEAVSGRVTFDAANGIWASHARIIGRRTREVNARDVSFTTRTRPGP